MRKLVSVFIHVIAHRKKQQQQQLKKYNFVIYEWLGLLTCPTFIYIHVMYCTLYYCDLGKEHPKSSEKILKLIS